MSAKSNPDSSNDFQNTSFGLSELFAGIHNSDSSNDFQNISFDLSELFTRMHKKFDASPTGSSQTKQSEGCDSENQDASAEIDANLDNAANDKDDAVDKKI